MSDLISVIVPIYNVENYLRKCIESIISQTYSTLEIILVNDGSLDNSALICNMLAKEDSRIKVIHKKNGGLSDARNVGLKASSGKYVSFIDSDDYIENTYFEVLLRLMYNENADIAQCNFKRIYESNKNNSNVVKENYNTSVSVFSNLEALNNLFNESYVQTVISCNKLYKRNLFDNIRFPVKKLHEDEFTTYKLLYESNKLAKTEEALYCYLQRTGSITQSSFNEKRLDAIEAYSEQISFYEEKELNDLKKKAVICLENILRRYMKNVIDSDLVNKDELFDYMHEYYKNYFHLFKNTVNKKSFKYIVVYIVKCSPKKVLKLLLKMM